MNQVTHTAEIDLPKPILPNWVFDARPAETLVDAGFASGAALALLHVVLRDPITNVATELLRNRLALRAAQNCCKIEGRIVTEAELRDAYLLAQPGDAQEILRGPNGDMLAFWRSGCSINLKHSDWSGRLRDLLPEEIHEYLAEWIDASDSMANDPANNPLSRSIAVLTTILKIFPRQEAAALLCADCVLSRALGWSDPIPMISLYAKRSDLRQGADGTDIRIAVHVAIAHSAQDAVRLSHDLARRAHHLRSIAPKLRTRGSEDAIKLFLSEDAVLPSTMLSPIIRGSNTLMTGRSARRLCDRLVELGVVRELTGRPTFRLYGVA